MSRPGQRSQSNLSWARARAEHRAGRRKLLIADALESPQTQLEEILPASPRLFSRGLRLEVRCRPSAAPADAPTAS